MIINQLFVKKPPYELLIKIIKAFGLNDINDNREFSHIDLDKHQNISLFYLKMISGLLKKIYY